MTPTISLLEGYSTEPKEVWALDEVTSGPRVWTGDDAVFKSIANRNIVLNEHASRSQDEFVLFSKVEAVRELPTPSWLGEATAALETRGTSEEARSTARRLLESLSSDLRAPDVYVDNQGFPVIEWFESGDFVLSVAVSSERKLFYSALFGENSKRGVEEYTGGSLPSEISRALARVLSHQDTAASID